MDISSHGDAEETERAKRIIEMEKAMEQEGVKCFVVMANRTDLAKFRTHVGTPSHLGHMDRVAATMPSQAHAGAAQEAPDIGRWEGQDVLLVRPSSCNFKGGIPSSRSPGRPSPSYSRGNP